MKSNYHEKREARIESYRNLAAGNEKASDDCYDIAHKKAAAIPFGQPILIGHHSEKADRNYRKSIGNMMDKSVEHSRKSKYYEEKAKATENNTAISSDNPDAIQLLQEKLDKKMKEHKFMLDTKKICRSKKTSETEKIKQLKMLGYNVDAAITMLSQDRHIPRFQTWECCFSKNGNATIKRIKNRIAVLKSRKNDVTSLIIINDIKIVDNVEENRLQMFFNGKPEDETRRKLKSHGFRWARSIEAWQRYRSSDAIRIAKEIATG